MNGRGGLGINQKCGAVMIRHPVTGIFRGTLGVAASHERVQTKNLFTLIYLTLLYFVLRQFHHRKEWSRNFHLSVSRPASHYLEPDVSTGCCPRAVDRAEPMLPKTVDMHIPCMADLCTSLIARRLAFTKCWTSAALASPLIYMSKETENS